MIIAGAGVSGREWTTSLTLFAIASLAFTFGLWFSYFGVAKDKLDSLLESLDESAVANLARDSFSMLHYPVLLGIIGVGAVIEQGIIHPDEPLHFEARVGLAVGIALFVAGMALAIKRAGGDWHIYRLVVTAMVAVAIVFIADVYAYVTVLMGLAGLIVIGIIENLGESSEEVDSEAETITLGG